MNAHADGAGRPTPPWVKPKGWLYERVRAYCARLFDTETVEVKAERPAPRMVRRSGRAAR